MVDSPAFFADAELPSKFTCDGEGVAPSLSWGPLPDNATHSALLAVDADAVSGDYVHWLWWDLGRAITFTPDGFQPAVHGATVGNNSAGRQEYAPPCPPRTDEAHRYVFTLYGLQGPLGLPAGSGRADFEAALAGKVLAQGSIVATYRR